MFRSLDLQDLAHVLVLGGDYQIAFNVVSIDTVLEGRCEVWLMSLASGLWFSRTSRCLAVADLWNEEVVEKQLRR